MKKDEIGIENLMADTIAVEMLRRLIDMGYSPDDVRSAMLDIDVVESGCEE